MIEGIDRGARFTISPTDPSPVLIGVSPACQIRLKDIQVSRRHAALEPLANVLRLLHFGSSNGTTVSGLLVLEVLLQGGEIVRMGNTSLRVARLEPAATAAVPSAMRFGRVIGGSFEMRRLYPFGQRLAASDMPLIIEGEMARARSSSPRRFTNPARARTVPSSFLIARLSPPIWLSRRSSDTSEARSTGASASRKGVFELADGGTLLIDEIGDLDISLQAKLLRAIERGEVQRVGADRWIRVDVRVIAATRRNLDQEIQAGRFRDHSFFRLAVARIELPPLRKRLGDVGLLARHFWRVLGGEGSPPDDFVRRLEVHHRPGNIRELQMRSSGACRSVISIESTAPPSSFLTHPTPAASPEANMSAIAQDPIEQILSRELPFPRARDEAVAEFQRRYVERLLARYGGSVSRAAAASGIALRYFQRIRARQQKRYRSSPLPSAATSCADSPGVGVFGSRVCPGRPRRQVVIASERGGQPRLITSQPMKMAGGSILALSAHT